MAVLLADLARNSGDKLVAGFINELITDSVLLSRMQFDDCMAPEGSDMVYTYKRITKPMEAHVRKLNAEPQKTDLDFERVHTNVAIVSASFPMDRVAKNAAASLYTEKAKELKNAIIRKYNALVCMGAEPLESEDGYDGFEGLDRILAGGPTEVTSKVDLSTVDQETALAFANEMDELFARLSRTPDVLLMAPAMKTKVNAVCRVLGLSNVTTDSVGRIVSTWNGVPIEEMRDGALTTMDVYAVCFGMEEFHGITLKGGSEITVNLPSWDTPGAVKDTDAEFVCGCALKQTHAAGVLRVSGSVPVQTVTLSQKTMSISGKTSKELTATVEPPSARGGEVTWESSDPSKATVADGKVTGVANGTTNVTAKCGGVTSAACVVTVSGVAGA